MSPPEHDLSDWPHVHVFDEANLAAERSTRTVMLITAATMVVEIAAGLWFNSMALLADGWHMSSHALAIGLSMVAYMASRRFARDPRFAFGTWKIEVLAGYSSALFLLGIAAWMVIGSVERLMNPQTILFREAILVAVIGLLVNIGCAAILGNTHTHHHDHHRHDDGDHDHHHDHRHHQDLNLRAAYVHVLTDAATSVLAIVALLGGMLYGWNWLDPVMGIVGAALVALWARGLIRDTSRVLLDREMHHPVVAEVRDAIRGEDGWGATRITDLHVWRIGRERYACELALATDSPAVTPRSVRALLAPHEELAHVTVEIERTEPRPTLGHRRIGHGDHFVLVLHEWLGDHANWDALWPLVDHRRMSWICADLRGYGWSRTLAGRYDADEAAADLLALMDTLGIGRFDVVGHSMSTLVAQRLAALAPRRVRRLALVSPVPPGGLHPDAATLATMRALINDDDALRTAIAARTGNRRDAQWIDRKLAIARGAGVAEAMTGYLHMFTGAGLATVRNDVPVLAVVGRHDLPFYREDAVRSEYAPLYEDFSLAISEESGHYAMLEDPAFLVVALETFFERV